MFKIGILAKLSTIKIHLFLKILQNCTFYNDLKLIKIFKRKWITYANLNLQIGLLSANLVPKILEKQIIFQKIFCGIWLASWTCLLRPISLELRAYSSSAICLTSMFANLPRPNTSISCNSSSSVILEFSLDPSSWSNFTLFPLLCSRCQCCCHIFRWLPTVAEYNDARLEFCLSTNSHLPHTTM